MTGSEIYGALSVLKPLADRVGISRTLGAALEAKLNLLLPPDLFDVPLRVVKQKGKHPIGRRNEAMRHRE